MLLEVNYSWDTKIVILVGKKVLIIDTKTVFSSKRSAFAVFPVAYCLVEQCVINKCSDPFKTIFIAQ